MAPPASTAARIWTKICGLRDPAQAAAICELGPSAVGLNFYPQSSRYVDEATAAAIRRQIPVEVQVVGVFVNSDAQTVAAYAKQFALDLVQFHGAETPDEIARFRDACPTVGIVRAYRRPSEGLRGLLSELKELDQRDVRPHAVLIDAFVPGSYGGTGTAVPWRELRQELETLQLPPVILAGGLHDANVDEAVGLVRPWGVDVASGVEAAPGVKDLTRVAAFLANAARQTAPRD